MLLQEDCMCNVFKPVFVTWLSYGVKAMLISFSDRILLAAKELQTSLKRSSGQTVGEV